MINAIRLFSVLLELTGVFLLGGVFYLSLTCYGCGFLIGITPMSLLGAALFAGGGLIWAKVRL